MWKHIIPHYMIISPTQNDDYFYMDPNGEGCIDLPHLCATMDGLIHLLQWSSIDITLATVAGDMAGWAGDLQTLCVQILSYTNNSNDFDTIYNATHTLLGENAYKFSIMDLLADVDAQNIYNLLPIREHNFIYAFITYYANIADARYTLFANGCTREQLYNYVRVYTTNLPDNFLLDWPFLAGYDLTDTQSDAIASAFTDYLWERIQNE